MRGQEMSIRGNSYHANQEESYYGDQNKNRMVQRKVKKIQTNVEESIQKAAQEKEERQGVKKG